MASKQFHDLGPEYDLIEGRDKAITVQQAYGTLSAAQAKFDRYWARLIAIMPQAEAEAALMNDAKFTACYMNAYIQGHAHAMNAAKLSSSCRIHIPWGEFWTTRELPIPVGEVWGAGTSWSGTSQASTVLSPWHENWRGDPKFRSVLVSQVRGTSGNMGYLESCVVDGIRFEGRALSDYYDASYESYGIMMAGAGEVNNVGTYKGVRCDHFNNAGFAWAGATPGKIGTMTAFKNRRAGIEVLGGALATMDVEDMSCDDNAYVARCVRGVQPNDGGDEGAMLRMGTVKLEGGTNTEAVLGGKHLGQMLLELIGQGGVTIDLVQMATTYYVNHAMIKVHPFLANYNSAQSMMVKIGMIKQNRNGRAAFEKSVIDTYNKKMWAAPGSYQVEDFVYRSKNNGTLKMGDDIITAEPYPQSDRLGHIAFDDTRAFDVAGGNPKFYFTGPPTWGTTPPPQPTCTWVPGTPILGPCVNNSQTVTTPYVSSSAGCTPSTPKPADVVTTQACGTTPPPTGQYDVTASPVNNATSNSTPLSQVPATPQLSQWAGVKKVVIEGFKVTALTGGYILTNAAGGIKIGGNGRVYYSKVGIGNDPDYYPPGTVKVGVAVNLTINLPVATTFTHLGALPDTGSGQAFSATKITVTG